jgi:antitoxin CptB
LSAATRDNLAVRRRRARFRAWRRGTREADLLLGRFADAHMTALGEHDLAAFERLMDVAETDLFDWISARTPVPAEYDTELFQAIRRFHNARDDQG